MADWPTAKSSRSAAASSTSGGTESEIPPEQLAKFKAVELLARREHSRRELKDKLTKRGHSDEAIKIALDELAERGWQSDERFAELFVEQRANRGKGPRLVRYELVKRGISTGIADEAMQCSEVDWQQVAARTLANRFIMGADYAKMRRFMEQRGFGSAEARAAIDALNQPE